MVIIAVVVAAVLVVLTAIQTTYPESSWVRSRPFRASAIVVAVLVALLTVISAIREERAQDELRQATAGLSRTIFLKDMQFELSSRAKISDVSPSQNGFPGAFVNVYVVPDGLPQFCEWPVTHTPNLSGQGAIFEARTVPSEADLQQLMVAQGVQMISFHGDPEPPETVYQFSEPTLVDDHRRRTLEEYETSYFVAEVTGNVSDVKDSALVLKGTRVPFIFERNDNRWIGITVFRSTWERRCERKTPTGVP